MKELLNRFYEEDTGTPSGGTAEADEIIKLKKERDENYVSKELYEKEKANAKKYRDALLSDKPAPEGEQKAEPTVEELDKVFKAHFNRGSNLSTMRASLALRNKVLEETGVDQYQHPGFQDKQYGEKLAKVVEESIDECGDDSQLFTALFNNKNKFMR